MKFILNIHLMYSCVFGDSGYNVVDDNFLCLPYWWRVKLIRLENDVKYSGGTWNGRYADHSIFFY